MVLGSEGYPARPVTGRPVTGVADAEAEGARVLQAGTARDADGRLVSAGGRVLAVVGTGADLAAARDTAYAGLAHIRLPGGFSRSDIAAAAARAAAAEAG